MQPQILIIGAGPAGLTAAAELARFGIRVRIVEKTLRPAPHSRALCLWSRTLELLDRAGCTDAFIAAGHQVKAAAIIADHKQIGRVDFSGVASPHPYALMVPQAKTEKLLESHLNSLGVIVERGAKLDFLLDSGATVKSALVHTDGRRESLETDWLIGCDGAASIVRDEIDLPYNAHTQQTDWAIADLTLQNYDAPEDEIVSYWHEDGFLAIFPIGGGKFRIIADAGPAVAAHPATPSLLQIQTLLDRRGPARLIATNPVWLTGFRIQERNVDSYRQGRVFLAGDAAHLHNPAGAQGMNMGMHDAFDLAWKLALVCRSSVAPDAILKSYDSERRPIADHVIANVHRLNAISMLKNPAAQRARNLLGGFLLGLAPRPRRRGGPGHRTRSGLPYQPDDRPRRRRLPDRHPRRAHAPIRRPTPRRRRPQTSLRFVRRAHP